MATVNKNYTAIIIGSTGAVGRDLVAELVKSEKCAQVIALARRDVLKEQISTVFPSVDNAAVDTKLEVRKVDFNSLQESDFKSKTGERADAVFCCLGTTRRGNS